MITIKERKTANERASLICVPSGYDWNPRGLFNKFGMKSHEWIEVVCCGILNFVYEVYLEDGNVKPSSSCVTC